VIASILKDVAVLTGISGILAIILVIAEYFLNNYGDFKITINSKKEITVKGGNSLLSSLGEEQIYLPSACGGRGSCGVCKCTVLNGGGPVLPTEKPFLNAQELAANVRLSCQVKVKADVAVQIPDSIFNIRRFETTISEIIDYTHDVKGVTFKLAPGEQIDFEAGQYVQLITEPYAKVKQRVVRAYSISSPPEIKDSIQLIIRLVPEGICTTWVHNYLKVGDKVSFTGPYGDFELRETQADIFFVAGGSGLAPIKSFLEHLQTVGTDRNMAFFFGARTPQDLYLVEEMRGFEKVFPHFTYIPVLSRAVPEDNWTGRLGRVMPHFPEYLKDPANTEGYLCGSPAMIESVTQALTELGIPRNKIYFDSFG
jgi:Na+-transporting NADH:ubiquinone oxidoreductase subunit F